MLDRTQRLSEPDATIAALGAIAPGRPWPMGASANAQGVNFAVCSVDAVAIELCLFDPEGCTELARMPLPGRSGDVWHGHLPGARAGLVYGLRAHGPWQPEQGLRFNPNKLLLDPWGREIVGQLTWDDIPRGDDPVDPQQPGEADNAAVALKSRVVDDAFDWNDNGHDDRAPQRPLADMVIYELHVRGFTRRLPGVPEPERGSFAGLASDAAIDHLQRLGITAVCLLPVQQALSEQRLVEMGLVNYWGYNTIGFFCPDPRLASTDQPRDEFRRMVQRLHAAGIEVLLDVVYNHTAEGDEAGPTLCWRGLDNRHWYRLPAERPGGYENLTGCGNALDIRQPRMLQMVLDSLRYWVEDMHVDGFRFDLAPVLGRGGAGESGFERDGPFFRALQQDPVLQRIKLIAEPWDIGPGGYQLGQFPRGWLEWNDRFRDTAKRFWLHGEGNRAELAQRLAGSADRFETRGRTPLESVNYVVSHDGFTLADLVSHDHRHNEANGEHNRDGTASNLSWNCGVEGPTDDAAIVELRGRLQRALLATVMLSQGTPMLAAGDELGHKQRGNNNPYCQDNDTTWIDWSAADPDLLEFTVRLLRLRSRQLPRGPRWFTGVAMADGRADLAWLRSDGQPMAATDWQNPHGCSLQAWFGSGLLLLINAASAPTRFSLPPGHWRTDLDTSTATGEPAVVGAAVSPLVGAHSLWVLSMEQNTSANGADS
ncbi:MAG: glycogen debranching protein GlgX [Rubrivivax sp.]